MKFRPCPTLAIFSLVVPMALNFQVRQAPAAGVPGGLVAAAMVAPGPNAGPQSLVEPAQMVFPPTGPNRSKCYNSCQLAWQRCLADCNKVGMSSPPPTRFGVETFHDHVILVRGGSIAWCRAGCSRERTECRYQCTHH
jgi:hypothetical protein